MDNVAYQENMLPKQNKLDGHDVIIIASTEIYNKFNKVVYTKPIKYQNEFGISVIRVPYAKNIPHVIARKARAYSNVYNLIEDFAPDIILNHGVQAYELLTLSRYKRKYPKVKIYLDSHSDIHNTAKGFLSKYILHKIFYKRVLHKILNDVEKIFYISYECKDFLEFMYDVPNNIMEFYPLGGEIFPRDVRISKRIAKRNELELDDNKILMVHSGRMRIAKRTLELLDAFAKTSNNQFVLLLIGGTTEEISVDFEKYCSNDSRIRYIGWKNGEEVFDYLCAADIYLQPGSQSATMQNAICCGCPIMLYPHKSHQPYLNKNGFYVETVEDMKAVFDTISANPEVLRNMRSKSLEIAHELLDYKKLASRLYV